VSKLSFFKTSGQYRSTSAHPEPREDLDQSGIQRQTNPLAEQALRRGVAPSLDDLSGPLLPLAKDACILNPAGGWAKWVAAVYALSFFLPAWVESNRPIPGYGAFLLGMLACCLTGPGLAGEFLRGHVPHLSSNDMTFFVGAVAWLANPGLLVGLVRLAMDRGQSAAALGIGSFLLGLCFFFSPKSDHFQLSWGYYCWMASMALLAAAGLRGLWYSRRWR
jgi:hypothetical protein